MFNLILLLFFSVSKRRLIVPSLIFQSLLLYQPCHTRTKMSLGLMRFLWAWCLSAFDLQVSKNSSLKVLPAMLVLLLLQISLSCLWLGHGEVVTSFESSCPQFFFRKTPPNEALEPENPAWICQRYKNQYYFATLYDRSRRIPVYSAYLYQPGPGTRPKTWLVEPQVSVLLISFWEHCGLHGSSLHPLLILSTCKDSLSDPSFKEDACALVFPKPVK